MKKALTTTAAALLAISAHAQSATSGAGAGSGSATSGISAGATGSTAASAGQPAQATARPAPNPDGPLGAFHSQDSIRVDDDVTAPNRVGGPVGVTSRPTGPSLPTTTSIDPRLATRPGLTAPQTGLTAPPPGLPPRPELNTGALPQQQPINDSSRWEVEMPEGALGAPGTGATQTGAARSIPSTGGAPRVATGALPPAVNELPREGRLETEPAPAAPRAVLNQAGGATTTDSTTVLEGDARADARTSAGSSASLNTTGIETPPAAPERTLDRALSAKIRSRLSETGEPNQSLSPGIVRDLRITSQNGTVTLEGTVNTEAERRIVENRARQVHGVAKLENRLKVRGQGSSPSGTESTTTSQPSQSSTLNPSGAPAAGEAGAGASLDGNDDLDLDDRHSEILPPQ